MSRLEFKGLVASVPTSLYIIRILYPSRVLTSIFSVVLNTTANCLVSDIKALTVIAGTSNIFEDPRYLPLESYWYTLQVTLEGIPPITMKLGLSALFWR